MYDLIYLFLWTLVPSTIYYYQGPLVSLFTLIFIYFLLNILPLVFGLEPIKGKDSLFLCETPANKLLVTSTAIFADKISLKKYKSCVNKSFKADPRTKKFLVTIFGRQYWKTDQNYNENNHYIVHSHRITKSSLENYITKISNKDLNPNHPPYELHFFKNYENKASAIVFKFHHSFADGLAIVSMMTWCADENSSKIFYSPKEIPLLKKLTLYILSILTIIYYFFSTILQKADKNSFHSQKLSGEKSISWTNKINLPKILIYCKQNSYTFNDLLTALVLESLQEYCKKPLGAVTATIPFSMRGQPKDGSFLKLENDLSVFPIEFPEVNQDLVANCSKIFNGLKSSIRPFVIALMMRLGVNVLPKFLMQFIVFHVVNKATLLFSNVGGPKGPIFFGGVRFDQIIGMSPNMAECGISVTSFSYTDHFVVTCYADKNRIRRPAEFIRILENKVRKKIANF